MTKTRIIKSYNKLDQSILKLISAKYPHGFEKHLVNFVNANGTKVWALPFETADAHYLIKTSLQEARGMVTLANQEEDYSNEVIDLEEVEIEEIQLDTAKEMAD